MFDKFADYMLYLLPSAFKRQKKKNQMAIYCKIIGKLYDELMQSLFRLREESIIETCSDCMLEVFGNDYDMMQMKGETYDTYRKRLQMKTLVAQKAGTLQGILYAMESVGYPNCTVYPFYLENPERWAEIRINVYAGLIDEVNTIDFSCVVAEVMKVKRASTLLHYRFYYLITIVEKGMEQFILKNIRFVISVPFWYTDRECRLLDGSWLLDGSVMLDSKRRYELACKLKHKIAMDQTEQETITNATVETRTPDYWFLDGTTALDGTRKLNSIYKKEAL